MIYTSEGFVIRKNDILNDDKIIGLLLEQKGKISCIAKGARKITSRKAPNLDLFNLCFFSIAKGRNIDIITELRLINSFVNIKFSVKSSYLLFYIHELLDKIIYDGENNIEVYKELKSFLLFLEKKMANISRNNLDLDSKKFIAYFNGKMLLYAGVFPELFFCTECRKKLLEADQKVYTKSGISHLSCSKGRDISNNAIKALRIIKEGNIDLFDKIMLDQSTGNNLYLLTIDAVEYTISAAIKSKKYI